ncbi:MAG: peptide-methionine (S)-S-oxide reductase [Planctomycetota bacterium]|nr:MAG: peptide-methionine (S)-S-oxide reductase [Planctomycetota bacterium]
MSSKIRASQKKFLPQKKKLQLTTLLCLFLLSCQQNPPNPTHNTETKNVKKSTTPTPKALATFGGGCFWCTEAIFERIQGVENVISGYAGGSTKNPTYEQVCSGKTGHAEVVQITYNPNIISYVKLLEIFWKTHDPTTPNQQGNDIGPQYRSIILYHNEKQKQLALEFKQKLEAAKIWPKPIVTEIVPLQHFYPAENYHQNYYQHHPNQGYCQFVITPKIKKLEQIFAPYLK